MYRVDMLAMGSAEIPGPELFWMSGWDRWFPVTFQVALIRGGDVTALVNTGPAADLTAMNDKWERMLGARARLVRGPGEFVADQLAAHGVSPDQVTHVILTPLQLYTVSNVALFSNADICIALRGWTHFHTTHRHPHDDRATSIPDEVLVHLVTTAWPRVRLLADEDELAPGLRTWWCGAHHRASVVVEADTAAGTAALSDAYFHVANVTDDHPLGISENIHEAIATYDRVRRTADLVVPLYDPANFERFPQGRIG